MNPAGWCGSTGATRGCTRHHAAEAAALRAAGIVAEAVPGPSVELATPAVAGIAVTDRRIAAAVTIGPAAVVGPPAHAGHTLLGTSDDLSADGARWTATGDGHCRAIALDAGPPSGLLISGAVVGG